MSEIQRIETHAIAPIVPGQLVTGVSMQVSGLQSIGVVAKVELRQKFDAAIRKQKGFLTAFQKDLTAAREAYAKEVATLGGNYNDYAAARNATDALRYFFPQISVLLAERRNADGNLLPPHADFPKVDVEVDVTNKTYTTTLYLQTSPRGTTIELDRNSPLPSRVLNALTSVEKAQANVTATEQRLRELAAEKATIPEKAEMVEAALVRAQMQEIGGKPYLDAMDAVTKQIVRDCQINDELT